MMHMDFKNAFSKQKNKVFSISSLESNKIYYVLFMAIETFFDLDARLFLSMMIHKYFYFFSIIVYDFVKWSLFVFVWLFLVTRKKNNFSLILYDIAVYIDWNDTFTYIWYASVHHILFQWQWHFMHFMVISVY